MGLDMYARKIDARAFDGNRMRGPDDFAPELREAIEQSHEGIAQWRKHPNLHGWMEQLWRSRLSDEERESIDWGTFNSVPVRLHVEDLDALEVAVNDDALPHTTGFFFGESRPERRQNDLEFIGKAREALAQGFAVYYDSWW
jgi:hypothetical protein